MFADDVVLCTRDKDVLELELEGSLGEESYESVKSKESKTEYMFLKGTPLGCVKMQSAQLPHVTEFKYLGSTLQSDGDIPR